MEILVDHGGGEIVGTDIIAGHTSENAPLLADME